MTTLRECLSILATLDDYDVTLTYRFLKSLKFPSFEDKTLEVERAYRDNPSSSFSSKIAAIKEYRDLFDCRLGEAKTAVEYFINTGLWKNPT